MNRWKILLSVLLLSLSFTSKAAHFVSGEIYWKHVGNRVFDVYVVYYNDCAGYLTNFPYTLYINGTSGTINKAKTAIKYDTITYAPASCGGPVCSAYKMYTRSEGRFRLDLSNDTSSSYTLSIEDCCRYNGLTNVDLSTSQAMTLHASMNLAGVDSQYWSSPRFLSDHQFTASMGGLHQISFMADDTINGVDSIAYELVSPYNTSTGIQYISGYSYSSPLKYQGYPISSSPKYGLGFMLDETKGQLVYTPMVANEGTAIAVRVKTYRKKNSNWVLASEIMRDITIVTQNATINKFPYFKEKLDDVVFCDTSDTHYDVVVADSNLTDSISLKLVGKLPEYTIEYKGRSGFDRRFRIHFNLSAAQWNTGDYHFVVQAADERCTGTAMGITQHGLTLKTTIDTSLLSGISLSLLRNCNTLNAAVSGLPQVNRSFWIFGEDTISQLNFSNNLQSDSLYTLSYFAERSACRVEFRDTIWWDSLYHFIGSISGFPTKTCVGQEMNLSWTVSGGLGAYRYFLNGNAVTNAMIISAVDSGYLAYAIDSSGCRIDTSITLQLYPELGSQSKQRISLCRENAQPFFVNSLPIGGAGGYRSSWNWTTLGDSFLVNTDTMQQLHYRIEDSIGCFFEDTLRFNIRPKPNYILAGNETHCFGDTFHLSVRHNFDTALVRFNWMNSWVKDSTYTIAPSQDSILYIQMRDTGNCTIVDQFSLNYHQGRLPKLADSIVYCQGDSLTLSNGFIGLYDTVTWTYLNTVVNQPNVSLGAVQDYSLKLRVVDEDACIYLDSTYVSGKKKPDIYLLMADTRWCENDQAFTLNDSVVQSGGVWRIDGVLDSVVNPSALSYGDHALSYELDSNGCKAISYQIVRIRKLPQVDFVVQNPQGNGPLQSKFIPAILADTAYALHWDFGDPATTTDTSSQDTSTYSYNIKGIYTPSLVVRTAYCSTTLEKDSAVQVYQGVGLNRIDNKLRIYPNPGKGIYQLQTGLLKVNSIRVYTSLGQEIYLQNQVPEDNTTFTFDLGSLSPGIYTLLVRTNENEFHSIKLIHQP